MSSIVQRRVAQLKLAKGAPASTSSDQTAVASPRPRWAAICRDWAAWRSYVARCQDRLSVEQLLKLNHNPKDFFKSRDFAEEHRSEHLLVVIAPVGEVVLGWKPAL